MENELVNLEELKKLYGEDSVKELVSMSLKEAGTLIEGLRKSVPARDASAVCADAHQLKGMSATMTMSKVADLAYKMELCAKSQTWDECETLLQSVESCFAELEIILSKVLA